MSKISICLSRSGLLKERLESLICRPIKSADCLGFQRWGHDEAAGTSVKAKNGDLCSTLLPEPCSCRMTILTLLVEIAFRLSELLGDDPLAVPIFAMMMFCWMHFAGEQLVRCISCLWDSKMDYKIYQVYQLYKLATKGEDGIIIISAASLHLTSRSCTTDTPSCLTITWAIAIQLQA